MAREARPQRRARELAGFNNKYPKTGAGTMTINEYVATTARAFMAAEIAMAAVNCGVADATAITALDPIGSEASKPGSKIASVNRSEGASQERVND
jgi:hypothetical protein